MRKVTKELLDSEYPFHIVSISDEDRNNGSPKVGDMIARNPQNHDDKWLVSKEYFENNFAPMEECGNEGVNVLYEKVKDKKKNWNQIQEIGDRCMLELLDSYDKFPDFNSHHEGYAIIKEEVDELWDAIKLKPRPVEDVKEEAIQVSAMAMKLLVFIYKNR